MRKTPLVILMIQFIFTLSLSAYTPHYTVFDKINQAFENGEINFDTQMLYYAYAIYKPAMLPYWYKEGCYPAYCVTPELRAIRRNRDKISPGIYEHLLQLTERPGPVVGSIHSAQYPAYIHYLDSAWAGQAATDMDYLNESWTSEVVDWGFDSPPPDEMRGGDNDYDCYLMDLGSIFGAMVPEDLVLGTPRFDKYGYIKIRYGMSIDRTKSMFAHELHHSLQYGMDAAENGLIEAGSTYAQKVVYDDSNDFYSQIADFQTYPHKNLLSDIGTFRYGAVLFYIFLEDRYFHNPDWYRRACQETTQVKPENEPDLFDGLETQLQELGVSMAEMWHEFSIWRLFTGDYADNYHFSEQYPYSPTPVQSISSSEMPFSFQPPTESMPEKAATNYIKLTPDDSTSLAIFQFLGTLGLQWSVSLVGIVKKGYPCEVFNMDLVDQYGEITIPDLQKYESLFIVITNLCDLDYEMESNWSEKGSYLLEIVPFDEHSSITNFHVQSGDESITISWINNSAAPIRGFNLYRSQVTGSNQNERSDQDEPILVNQSVITGNRLFCYVDENILPGCAYHYELHAVDKVGRETFCCEGIGRLTCQFAPRLSPPMPNPTRDSTSVHLSLSQDAKVELAVYDLSGRMVRRLAAGKMAGGEHVIAWDGRNSSGQLVANGVYLVNLVCEGNTQSQKIIVSR